MGTVSFWVSIIVVLLIFILFDVLMRANGGILGIGSVFLVLIVSSLLIFSDSDETIIKDSKSEHEILALKDNVVSGSGGSFFLGLGNVDGEPYYFYMQEMEMGKKMERVKVSSAYIKEVDTKNPSVEIYDLGYNSGFIRWMIGEVSGEKQYVFNVPKGTVTTDFVVDME